MIKKKAKKEKESFKGQKVQTYVQSSQFKFTCFNYIARRLPLKLCKLFKECAEYKHA